MKQLWAPWRMQYIQDHEPQPDCLFCKKASEDADEENYIVHRGARCFVMLNLYPYNSGHLMVVPYEHVAGVEALRPETGADIFAATQLAVEALRKSMGPDGFNIGLNQGAVAGAGIADHIHLHIVPRWNGDTNFIPVLADTKVIPELLSATATKLRSHFRGGEEDR